MIDKKKLQPLTDYFVTHSNTDGLLGTQSYSEFLVSSVDLENLNEEIGRKIFSNFDTNNSGFITPYNFAPCLARSGQTLNYADVISEFETHGTDSIDFQKFLHIIKKTES